MTPVRVLARTLSDVISDRLADGLDDARGLLAFSSDRKAAFQENPSREGRDHVAQLVAVSGCQPVGRLDLFPGAIEAGGTRFPVLFGSNLFVEPEHRSTGAGLMLLLHWQAAAPVSAGCGASQAALPLYLGLKWEHRAMERRLLPFTVRPIVQRALKKRGMARGLALLPDLALSARRTLQFRGSRRGIEAVPVSSPLGPEFDELRSSGDRPRFVRDRAWLEWCISHRFGCGARDERRLFVLRVGGGRTEGYLLLRFRHYAVASRREFPDVTIGSLVDWQVRPGSTIGLLDVIVTAARLTRAGGADVFEVCCPDRETSDAARRAGMLRAGALHLVMRTRRVGAPAAIPPLASGWDLRPGEGDHVFS